MGRDSFNNIKRKKKTCQSDRCYPFHFASLKCFQKQKTRHLLASSGLSLVVLLEREGLHLELTLGELEVALGKHASNLGVGHKLGAVVNCQTTDLVVGLSTEGLVVGEHPDLVELTLLHKGVKAGDLAGLLPVELGNRDVVGLAEAGGLLRGKNGVASLDELLQAGLEVLLEAVLDGYKDVLALRDGVGKGRESGLEEGLVHVLTVASDLTSRSHLDTKLGVSTGKTLERELRDLGTDVGGRGGALATETEVLLGKPLGLASTDHGHGGNLNEVSTNGLGRERERTRSTDVSLNNLHGAIRASNELLVEGTSDVEGLGNAASGLAALLKDLLGEVLGREHKVSVTGVNTGVLNVLRDGVGNDLTVLSDGININLASVLNESSKNNRVVTGDLTGTLEVLGELSSVVGDAHGGTGEHVRGANENGVANLVSKGEGILGGGEARPLRLVNAKLVTDAGELITVLSRVNHDGRGTSNLHTVVVHGEGNVVRELATNRHDGLVTALELIDIEDTLERKLLKVELVTLVEVSGYSLRVVVDHDTLLAKLAEGADGGHRAPIELNTGTDTVDTRSEDHGSVVVKGNVRLITVVSGVQVVGGGGGLTSDGINLLDNGHDTHGLTGSTDGELVTVDAGSDLAIRETRLLCLKEEGGVETVKAASLGHHVVKLTQTVQLVEEPGVNVGVLVDTFNRPSKLHHGVGNSVRAHIRGLLELLDELSLGGGRLVHVGVRLEALNRGVDHTHGLLERLLPGAADTHDLTDGLHGRSDLAGNKVELGHIPTGDLGHHVIERRLEAGSGALGDLVGDVRELDTKRELGSHEGKRVTSGLGGKGRGTGKTRVNLNNSVLVRVRVEGVLNVALTNDAKVLDSLDGGVTEHLVIEVGEGLGRGDDNGITGVDTERIKVLHVTHGDAVVGGVTNNLVLNLLPAEHGLLDENLGRGGEGLARHLAEVGLILTDTGSETTKGECGTDHAGEANLVGSNNSIIDAGDGKGRGKLLVNLIELVREDTAILSGNDRLNRGTKNLDIVLGKNTLLVEFNTDVKCGLATHGKNETVGLLTLDDLLDKVKSHRQEVNGISLGSTLKVGLHRGNVGVHEDSLDTLLLERLDGLVTGVVELTGLTNGKTTRAEKENLLGLNTSVRNLAGVKDGTDRGLTVLDHVDEVIKEELSVSGTSLGLRVELSREVGLGLVHDTLVGAVVTVDEEGLPVLRKSLSADGVAVVLRGDEALAGAEVEHRLVSTTVTEAHLVGLSTGGESSELVPHTDTKDGLVVSRLKDLAEVVDSLSGHDGISGTVGKEETIKLIEVLGEGEVVGHTVELNTTTHKVTNDVVLDTAVKSKKLDRVASTVNDAVSARNLLNEVAGIDVNKLKLVVARGLVSRVELDLGLHATTVTDLLGKKTGVNAVETRDLLLAEPRAEAAARLPVAEVVRVVADEEGTGVNLVALKVLGKTKLVNGALVGDTVVTN
mmetsp:Transcript_14281/g.23195  ORF Transcript_14281/g.23195 Transcript_14281/m.23195 type:complete len:1459 (-) Transcript_14281:343-4719(-)